MSDIIEAAARAIKDSAYTIRVPTDIPEHCYDEARAALTAVSPLIEARALERLKAHLEYHLNARLCEMEPDHDDSITGFNEACVIVAGVVEDELTRLKAEEQP